MVERAEEPTRGLSRRDLMKRGAVVGGIVWAAPTIDSIKTIAAAASVGPNGGPCTPKPGACAISLLDLWVQHTGDSNVYLIVFDGTTWGSAGGGTSLICTGLYTGGSYISSGAGVTAAVTAFGAGATVTGTTSTGFVVTPPPNYSIVFGATKGGTQCLSSSPCGNVGQQVFSLPPKNIDGNCGNG